MTVPCNHFSQVLLQRFILSPNAVIFRSQNKYAYVKVHLCSLLLISISPVCQSSPCTKANYALAAVSPEKTGQLVFSTMADVMLKKSNASGMCMKRRKAKMVDSRPGKQRKNAVRQRKLAANHRIVKTLSTHNCLSTVSVYKKTKHSSALKKKQRRSGTQRFAAKKARRRRERKVRYLNTTSIPACQN